MTIQVNQTVTVTNLLTNQKCGAVVSQVNTGTGLFYLAGFDMPFNIRTNTAGSKFLVTK